MPRAANRSPSATLNASSGSFNSRAYSALRGWNQARSLLRASSTRKWMASGRNPLNSALIGRVIVQ